MTHAGRVELLGSYMRASRDSDWTDDREMWKDTVEAMGFSYEKYREAPGVFGFIDSLHAGDLDGAVWYLETHCGGG